MTGYLIVTAIIWLFNIIVSVYKGTRADEQGDVVVSFVSAIVATGLFCWAIIMLFLG